MEKKLYIHVGTPKTGTTAIQQFCAKNKEAFENRKYCYPIFPYRYPNKAMVRNGHFLAGRIFDEQGKRCPDAERQIFQEGMEIVKRLFDTYDGVVLSDEALWHSTTHWRPGLWKELNKIGKEIGFKVVIIVYLRRQDEYLESLWSQFVKEGYLKISVKTWDEWFPTAPKEKVTDYKAKMDEYIAAVGKENVVVRRFYREEFAGGSLYSDFLRTINLEMTEDFMIPENEVNRGLKGNINEIRRIINTLPEIEQKDHKFFQKTLVSISEIADEQYSCSVMSEKERETFLATYREGNREIAKLFFGEDGDLFKDNDENIPKWEKDNPYMLDDVIRFIGRMALELREENRKLTEKQEYLRGQLENIRHPVRFIFLKVINKMKSMLK